jgi:hypothetical protein
MKYPFRVSVLCVALLASLGQNRAFAAGPDDGGADGDALVGADVPSDGGSAGSDDASVDGPGGGGTPGAPGALGCDGDLCSTATGGTTCSTAQCLGSTRVALPTAMALLIGVVGLGTLRRRMRRQQERVR